jgi:hypothetical protein
MFVTQYGQPCSALRPATIGRNRRPAIAAIAHRHLQARDRNGDVSITLTAGSGAIDLPRLRPLASANS